MRQTPDTSLGFCQDPAVPSSGNGVSCQTLWCSSSVDYLWCSAIISCLGHLQLCSNSSAQLSVHLGQEPDPDLLDLVSDAWVTQHLGSLHNGGWSGGQHSEITRVRCKCVLNLGDASELAQGVPLYKALYESKRLVEMWRVPTMQSRLGWRS